MLIYPGAALIWPPHGLLWPMALAALFIWASVTDWQRLEIPDMASALLLSGGAIWLWQSGYAGALLADHLAGAALWPAMAAGVAGAYRRWRGYDGLGFGDVKLLAGIGIWAGFSGTVWVMLAAALAGIAVLMLAGAKGKDGADARNRAVAFGPFLCLSAWVVVLQAGQL